MVTLRQKAVFVIVLVIFFVFSLTYSVRAQGAVDTTISIGSTQTLQIQITGPTVTPTTDPGVPTPTTDPNQPTPTSTPVPSPTSTPVPGSPTSTPVPGNPTLTPAPTGGGGGGDEDDDDDGQDNDDERSCGSNPQNARSRSDDDDFDDSPNCVDRDDDNAAVTGGGDDEGGGGAAPTPTVQPGNTGAFMNVNRQRAKYVARQITSRFKSLHGRMANILGRVKTRNARMNFQTTTTPNGNTNGLTTQEQIQRMEQISARMQSKIAQAETMIETWETSTNVSGDIRTYISSIQDVIASLKILHADLVAIVSELKAQQANTVP